MTTSSDEIATRAGSDGWKLNGWHVLAGLIVFFGVMIAVNGVFLYFAMTTFTGIETADAYRKGVAYNASLEESRQLDKLGWKGALKATGERIEFVLKTADGAPVRGVRVEGRIGRPATDTFDRTVAFEDAGSGVYRSQPLALAPGNWILALEAHDPVDVVSSPRYRLKERLWLSQ
ncbi:MAG: FixH family protein [Alphaproteobacteria bacterium]|nr:FixH family protein [Alphaproteobacteria bacterium]